MLSFLIIVVLVVCLIVMGNERNRVNHSSASYRQGYWDGVRASEQGVRSPEAASGGDAESSVVVATPETDELGSDGPSDKLDTLELSTVSAAVVAPSPPAHDPTVHKATRVINRVDTHPTINIALYVATLLLVSGVILLAQTVGLDSWLRFILVWLLIGCYYIAGFVLMRRTPIVRPAAITFVGTALAAIPVAGITMYLLVAHDPALCWFVTSLVGAVLFVIATIKLKSQFLAYISILSVFILCCTLPAMAHAQLVWYYVVMIAFGAALTLLASANMAGVPKEFALPIRTMSPAVVPVALLGALFSYTTMTPAEYTAVIGAALAYYVADARTAASKNQRDISHLVARVLTLCGAVSVAAWAGHDSRIAMSYSLAAVGLINVVASLVYLPARVRRASTHELMVWIGFIASVFVAPLLIADITTRGHAFAVTIELIGVFVTSLFAAYRTKRYELLWPGVITTFVLPNIVGHYVAMPPFATSVYVLLPMVMILCVLFLRAVCAHHHLSLNAAALMYVTVVIWLLMALIPAVQLGGWWLCGWWALAALVAYYSVVVESARVMLVAAHGLLLLAVGQGLLVMTMSWGATLVLLSWISAIMATVASEYARRRPEKWWQHFGTISIVTLFTYAALIGTAALVPYTATGTERLLAWLPFVAVCYYMAYRMRHSALLYVGNIAAVVLVILMCMWAEFPLNTTFACVAWFGLIGLYGVGQLYRRIVGNISVWQAMFNSAAVTTVAAGIIGAFLGGTNQMLAAGFALMGIGAVLCYDDYEFKRLRTLDIGTILIMLGAQRSIAVLLPGISYLFYTHLWAALAFGLAWVYYRERRMQDGLSRVIIGLCLITLPGFMSAMSSGGGYQLLFLVEHVGIVLVGLSKSHKLSAIWGAVGVTFAILYMLRGYQALMNIVIGLLVIGAVVYVIIRADRRTK